MDFAKELIERGFRLTDVCAEDLADFILVENLTHNKYVAEHKEFLGEYEESVIVDGFRLRQQMTYFKKIIYNDETIGFLSYNQKEDIIDRVFIRIIPEFQNRGIGSMFLVHLKELSEEFGIPVEVVAIKTNPAKQLYMRMGFQLFKEQDVFCYFKYEDRKEILTKNKSKKF